MKRKLSVLADSLPSIGGASALAKKIGVSPQSVSNWLRRGRVPVRFCPIVERATKRAVLCEELRPDVDWAFLRGTKNKAA